MILTSWLTFPHEQPFTSISTMDAMSYAWSRHHLLCIQRDGRAPPLLLMNSKKPQSEIYYNLSSFRKPLDIHTNMLAPETLDCTHFIKYSVLKTNYCRHVNIHSFLQKNHKKSLTEKTVSHH